jgi:ABC-type phosphate/phosphonate transport system substrate-binding protein
MQTKPIRALLALCLLCAARVVLAAEPVQLWFPPSWKGTPEQANVIADALSARSGLSVVPRVARYYPEILKAFDSRRGTLVYAGSFVQAVLVATGKGVPLAQGIDGQELYAAVMLHRKGTDHRAILRDTPDDIAFAIAASSGETAAMAATGGRAAHRVADHKAAAQAVVNGNAKGAFVKSWWWEANRAGFPALEASRVDGVSDVQNPDNVLTASVAMREADRKRVADAAVALAAEFRVKSMVPFDPRRLDGTLRLMRAAGIEPDSYSWR